VGTTFPTLVVRRWVTVVAAMQMFKLVGWKIVFESRPQRCDMQLADDAIGSALKQSFGGVNPGDDSRRGRQGIGGAELLIVAANMDCTKPITLSTLKPSSINATTAANCHSKLRQLHPGV
jgi:hypothetical protein